MNFRTARLVLLASSLLLLAPFASAETLTFTWTPVDITDGILSSFSGGGTPPPDGWYNVLARPLGIDFSYISTTSPVPGAPGAWATEYDYSDPDFGPFPGDPDPAWARFVAVMDTTVHLITTHTDVSVFNSVLGAPGERTAQKMDDAAEFFVTLSSPSLSVGSNVSWEFLVFGIPVDSSGQPTGAPGVKDDLAMFELDLPANEVPVPEPGSMSLFASGGILLAAALKLRRG